MADLDSLGIPNLADLSDEEIHEKIRTIRHERTHAPRAAPKKKKATTKKAPKLSLVDQVKADPELLAMMVELLEEDN